MRCKIVRFQKLMWRNMIRSIKSQKVSVLHYSIDIYIAMDHLLIRKLPQGGHYTTKLTSNVLPL
jgi:hypothetical protein